MYQLRKTKNIIHYFWSFFNYYYKIWNFKNYSLKDLFKYNKKFKNLIIPQIARNNLSKNYYSYLFSQFARSENYNYKFNSKLHLKTFINKLHKNRIQICPIYSYFKNFERYAFNQKYLLFSFFDINRRTLMLSFKVRTVKRIINTFITQHDLKTLKHLKFYRRKVTTRRTFKRR
jgi:predicted amidophosphoribosyltransferase